MKNRKYDVFGMGNALVDMEFEVTEEFLQKYEVDKGMMTLVDEKRQFFLLKAMEKESTKMQCGGSAGNSMISISQFGGRSFYSCKVANDEFGRFFIKDLHASGVDSKLKMNNPPEGITGKCLVMITPDADRTMNTFLGITSTFSTEELDEEALKDSSFLYIEGYLVASSTGQKAMVKAHEIATQHGVKTALTFSDPNMVKYFNDGMHQVVGKGIDLIFCNEDEALTYTSTSRIEDAREKLKQVANTFVITQGKNGAMIFDGDTFIDIEPYHVNAVDSNGAGDMFAGAFLYGITHGHSYAQAGKIASLASSKVVAQFGPRLEWSQTKEILNHLFE